MAGAPVTPRPESVEAAADPERSSSDGALDEQARRILAFETRSFGRPSAKAEVILLDNMAPDMIRKAVQLVAAAAVIEVSGGVRLATIRDFALPGVDVISVGALTHSATAVDLSLDIQPARAPRR